MVLENLVQKSTRNNAWIKCEGIESRKEIRMAFFCGRFLDYSMTKEKKCVKSSNDGALKEMTIIANFGILIKVSNFSQKSIVLIQHNVVL